ncbi:MAG: tetratricopeptide repeat protein [Prolixibacteraceae bacterium]|nr:tetratricopeptide repeat protein [Prolixibacteraceae bacterium]
MAHNRLFFKYLSFSFIFTFLFVSNVLGQQNAETFSLKKVIDLYNTKNYIAATEMSEQLIKKARDNQPLVFDLEYYRLMSLIRQDNKLAESELSDYLDNNQSTPWKNQLTFELARLQFSNKRYRSAIKNFEATDPSKLTKADSDDFYFYLGYSYFESGDLKKASQYFYDVKRGNSTYAQSASYYWGYINYLEGNYETALMEFSKLEHNRKFSGFISYYTTQIYYLQEKYDRVIETGEKIVNGAPPEQRNELYKIIGDAYFETGRYINAVKYLDAYKGVSGRKSREDYYRLAICYENYDENEKAIEAFSKVTVRNDLLAQNALYHMAGCYLKMNDKQKARAAFEQASKFDFDPAIEEDALFNYAKLSYELSYSPFNEAIKAFDQYITKYPDSERNDAAFDYLVKVFMTTRNYRDAINSIEKIKVKSASVKEAYQRVTYFRGLELFNDGQYSSAIGFFEKSIENGSYNRNYKAEAIYWNAEANYRLERYQEALDGFLTFQKTPGAFSSASFGISFYNIGYCYFNMKRYDNAQEWFRKYLSQSRTETRLIADAYNRLGDCYYLGRDYEEAINYYTKSYTLNIFDPDYALYQRAICQGLLRNFNEKVTDLAVLTSTYKTSSFIDDALYESARTHERTNDYNSATNAYQKLISDYPKSSLTKKALLQLGIIYYNQNNLQQSLKYYKQLAEQYPKTEEAKAALVGIKNNYIEMNRVDDYFTYVQTLGGGSEISSSAQDSIFYISAEKLYMSGGNNADIQFEEYLKRFPDGNFTTNATFYLAEHYYKNEKYSKSLELYEKVTQSPENIFTEQALLKAGELTFNAGDFAVSLNFFERLGELASTKWNVLKARAGIMRCHFEQNQSRETIEAAKLLKTTDNVTELMVREANFNLGKSYFLLNNEKEALPFLTEIAGDTKNAAGAEAKYLVAKIYYNQNKLEECENEIMDFISKNTPHQYWLAKSFILLSDLYLSNNDLFQARHTLKSIIDNYTNEGDGIKETAMQKLKLIEEKENESILDATSNPSDSTSIN